MRLMQFPAITLARRWISVLRSVNDAALSLCLWQQRVVNGDAGGGRSSDGGGGGGMSGIGQCFFCR